MARHSLDPVPSVRTLRSTIPLGLEESLNRGLEKTPADRFPTVEQFVEAVTGEQAVATDSARGVAGARPRGQVKRYAWAGLAAAAVTAVALVGRYVDLGALFKPDEEQLVAVLDFDPIVPDSLEYLARAVPEFLATAMGPRALGRRLVRRTWAEVLGTTVDPQARYDRVAAALGATHVLRGEVILQPDGGVRVRAELLRGREIVTEAVAVAPTADAIAVAETLGVQLLAGSAGEFHRLSGLATSSTATVQDWLRGMEAFREGRYEEAVEAYSAALDEDSTFALAAWGLMNASLWLEGGTDGRARRLAWQHRDRLPPADSAMFVAESQRNGYPEAPPGGEMGALRLYERAVQMYPERWDAWFRYGDFLWHEGGAYVDDGRPTALQAFNRAIALDSVGHDEAWRHLSEHYVLTGNREAFLALPPEHQDRGVGVVLTLMDGQSGIDPTEREWFEGSYQQPIHGLMEFQAAGAAMGQADRRPPIQQQLAEIGHRNSPQVAG
ncbi:MAG: tetratricopeptide repeat protein, partial [Gemmatimonadales bacterium]